MLAFLATSLFLAALPVPAPAASPDSIASPAPVTLPAWYSRLSPDVPGTFPPPRLYSANYRVAWSGLEAARVDTEVTSPGDGAQIRTSVHASTTGMARTLYKLDAVHLSVIDRRTFRPQYLDQTEHGSHKDTSTHVDFTADGATRSNRDLTRGKTDDAPHKPRHFAYPGLFDMEGVLLELRSLPLAVGDEKTYLFMTSGSPYLATVKVLGRETVHVRAGGFPSIRCSLQLEKVGKNGSLEPRKGFKSGEAWLSDDANRLLIKAQTDLFIGAVSLELETVKFTDPAR